MSDIIRQLPDSVANQIAAGEVIQRPASVIKELVENAVDAGATYVRIVIKDAGRTLIQVIDDGKGMSPTDARMAFERHATSKITAADDLFMLRTMGFRGEALPSICAISTVELRTMQKDAEIGTRLVITGSKKESQEPCVCEQGCNFMVKNLFFNVPARRKFLKSDTVELANIMREFERLALVNHGIRFSIDTGNKTIDLRAGNFKQRIADIWKNNLNTQLIPVDVETSLVKIYGYVSRPEFARRRNALQYLIANGRNMVHPYFRKAIESAYDGLIAHDTKPCFFLRFDVDPSTIDVNISPTKHEIKFENEQLIWPILNAAVKSALGKYSAGPGIDFGTDALDVAPARDGEFVAMPGQGVDDGYNPFNAAREFNPFDVENAAPARRYTSSGIASAHRGVLRPNSNWDRLYADFMNGTKEHSAQSDDKEQPLTTLSFTELQTQEIPMCIQVGAKYILSPQADGVLLVDQYRAHLRILFDRYMHAIENDDAPLATQRVLFSEPLELDTAQQTILESVLPQIRSLGFVLEPLGEGEWRIDGVPSSLDEQTGRAVVLNIISSMSEGTEDYGDEAMPAAAELKRRVALAAAKNAAIHGGQTLTPSEMEHLIADLLSLADPRYTPDGNPVMRTIPIAEIASLLR